MDFGVKDKVVVVTGGATGIGKAIAQSFHDEGAIVVINGRTQSKLDSACAEIGERAHGVVADLRNAKGAEDLFDYASALGPVEFLINNIGVYDTNDFFEVSDDRWIEYYEHNIMTSVRISRLVMQNMLDRNSGSIVFIASEVAIRPIGNMVPYSTSKSAMLGLSRSLAELTRGTNVRVTSYMPGTTATESVINIFGELAKEQGRTIDEVVKDHYRDEQPSNLSHKLIDPEMHGRGVLQLATNTAMNGVCHRADGGTVRSIFG